MNGYVTQIVSAITSVQGGGGGSKTKDIKDSLKSGAGKAASVATAPARFVGRELKEKIWDGKISKGPNLRGEVKEEAPLKKRGGGVKASEGKGDDSK
jgi:hypothetical protein